jgi:putative nucleotidyltransferase with HDIG domain
MVQAAMWARGQGWNRDVQLAALLHDIGHLVGTKRRLAVMADSDGQSLGAQDHEKVGADFLRKLGIRENVCEIVASHVDAKRYLCTIDPTYHASLSEASRRTLEHQGGRMSEREIAAFSAHPQLDAVLAVRTAEENAKNPRIRTAPARPWLELLLSDDPPWPGCILARTERACDNCL